MVKSKWASALLGVVAVSVLWRDAVHADDRLMVGQTARGNLFKWFQDNRVLTNGSVEVGHDATVVVEKTNQPYFRPTEFLSRW